MSEEKKCCGGCASEREKKLEKALKAILRCRQLSHAKNLVKEALQ